MDKKGKKSKEKIMDISSVEVGEDDTLEEQKKKADKLENITKDE